MADWKDQWGRVQRSYERFQKIDQGQEHTQESDQYRDDVYSFFIHCYHLKDWLKNDPASGVGGREVEAVVAGSLNLRLCGDVANGVKHAELTRKPKVASDTKIAAQHINIGISSGLGVPKQPVRFSAQYEIQSGGNTYDAFTVATAAKQDWENFLGRKGLL